MLSAVKLLELVRNKPLCTLNQLSLVTGYRKQYVKVLVNRLIKRGIIFKIERGKFTAHDNPLIFASHIVQPSYLTLWSALSFYGLTTQLPQDVFVAVKTRRKPITFQKTTICFMRSDPFGFQKKTYQGIEVFVAEKEKLLVDIISTNIVPLYEIGELVKEIDAKKILKYDLKNKSLMKRIGFLLDEYHIKVPNVFRQADNNYVPLIKSGKKRGKRNKKWRIIDNR